ALLPDVRRASGGEEDSHRRRSRRWRHAASDAAGLHGSPRPAMRLLHAGLSDAGRRRAGARAGYFRRQPARRAVVEPMPLHRLSEHHQGRARSGKNNARKMTVNFVGRSVPRLEDRPLLKGEGRFAADISFPGQWHMRVVRSSVAHGKIKSIDTSEALKLTGVHAVWTAADVAHIQPIPFRLTGLKSLEPYRQPVLAKDVERYVGEPVAVIFAENAYLAEDAADLVVLDIEHRPATMLAIEQPGVYEHDRSTEAGVLQKTYGDVDAAFQAAHAILSLELSVGRHSGVPLETRGAIARYDETKDILEMHGAAKVPHWNRDTIAQMLGRKRDSVQLFERHVGGGFGIRGEIYPEDVLVCAAALKFRKPIKWIEDRREHLIAANHSREQHHRIRA